MRPRGHDAVKVFFVVSGFLITSTILARWGTLPHIDLKTFYRLRAARIAPLLLGILAILRVLNLSKATGFVINAARASLPRALFAALTFHLNWAGNARGLSARRLGCDVVASASGVNGFRSLCWHPL